MVKPLDSQSPSFCLGCVGTDNKFIAETVIMRWNYIVSDCKKRNIHVISFGGDGDGRLMRARQISTGLFFQSSVLANTVCASSLKSPRIPESWYSWFLIKHPSAITYVQDTIHIAVKLKTRLLRHSLILPIGNYIVAVQHLQLLYANFQKEQHGLRQRDLDSKDKQNFDAVVNIIRASPYLDKIPDALGTKLYIEVIQNIIDCYLDKTLDPLQRIEKIRYSLFFLRYWRCWISAYSLQTNFITANAYKCVELNSHGLIIALIISRDNFEGRCCFMPWLFGSQSCEEAFRSVRSMSGIFSTVINFGMLGLLRRLHLLDLLSRLEPESKETRIIYPDQTHQINKMAKETRITSFQTFSNFAICESVMKAKRKAKLSVEALEMNLLLEENKLLDILPKEDYNFEVENDAEDDDCDESNSPDESTVTANTATHDPEEITQNVLEIEEDMKNLHENELISSQAVANVQKMFKRIPGFESSISLFIAKDKPENVTTNNKSIYSPYVEVKIDDMKFKELRKSTVSESLLIVCYVSKQTSCSIQFQQRCKLPRQT